MSRLPGNLSVVRGCWLLLRFYIRTVALAFFVVAVAVAASLSTDRVPGDAAIAALLFVALVTSSLVPAGVPVTDRDQPELYALVRDAAARLGVPAPDRVWLGGEAMVTARARPGRRELVIGLPVAYALSNRELAALVEHELAVLDTEHGWLSVPLYRRWDESMGRTAALDEGEPPSRRDARVLKALGPLGSAVEQRVDAALTDPCTAARALIRQERVTYDYALFCSGVIGKFSGGLSPHRIEDLHDGWHRRLTAGVGIPFGLIDSDEVAMVVSRHPALHDAAQALVGQEPPAGPDPDAVTLTALSRRQQRRLAAQVMPRNNGGSWRTFQTAPQRIWRKAAKQDARQVLDAVEEVLGREPADRAAAADIVRSRPIEVALAAAPNLDADDLDVAKSQAVDWLDLLEDALFDRGWVRVDPVVPGVLRDAEGTQLDGTDLTRRATDDPLAYAELRRLLADPN